jgi:hypothetical protein
VFWYFVGWLSIWRFVTYFLLPNKWFFTLHLPFRNVDAKWCIHTWSLYSMALLCIVWRLYFNNLTVAEP